jgi:hypothetical protein
MPKREIRELATLPNERVLRGYEVDYEINKESWGEYSLQDGTRVRVKHSVLKMFRLVDENGEPSFDKDGDPEVFLHGAIIVVASKGDSSESE